MTLAPLGTWLTFVVIAVLLESPIRLRALQPSVSYPPLTASRYTRYDRQDPATPPQRSPIPCRPAGLQQPLLFAGQLLDQRDSVASNLSNSAASLSATNTLSRVDKAHHACSPAASASQASALAASAKSFATTVSASAESDACLAPVDELGESCWAQNSRSASSLLNFGSAFFMSISKSLVPCGSCCAPRSYGSISAMDAVAMDPPKKSLNVRSL